MPVRACYADSALTDDINIATRREGFQLWRETSKQQQGKRSTTSHETTLPVSVVELTSTTHPLRVMADDSDVPETVTTLRCPNGSTVYLVGTAHFSVESIEDVRSTIRQSKPDAVVLELCPDRQLILHYSEEDILREARTMNFAKMRSFIHRDGFVAGITQSIFLKLSAELTEKLGVAPGGEFRAGYEEAKKIGSKIVLGDRQVGVTFKRALRALSFWQRFRFAYLLVQSLASSHEITAEEIERLKNKDMVTMLTGELASEFPALSKVFVTERDQILAYSLMVAANCMTTPYGPPVTVVGVMGMGHIPGIEANWNQVVDVRDLLTVPVPSRTSRLIWTGVRMGIKFGIYGICAAAIYFGYRKFFS